MGRPTDEGTSPAGVGFDRCGGSPNTRAHVALQDGRDLASAIRGHNVQAGHHPEFGAGLDKVWRYPAHIRHIVDGDTVSASIDLGVPTRYVNAVRIQHVNAPEKRTPGGDAATAFAVATIPTDQPVTIVSHELERYGRILGTLTLPNGRGDYGTELLAAGHAIPYEC